MISIVNLQKKFGSLQVLKQLNLEIQSGGIYALLGPNGSGKTTLIKCILGMIIPDAGEIKLNNENILGKDLYRNDIDYLPQIANFPNNLKVSEIITLVQKFRSKPTQQNELIELFELSPFLDKKLNDLSGGTRQKVNLVLTYMFDSPIVILDEPTSGLDSISLLHLKTYLQNQKSKNKIIIISTHIMSFAEEVADEVIFLSEGEIYFKGSLKKLFETSHEKTLELASIKILKQKC